MNNVQVLWDSEHCIFGVVVIGNVEGDNIINKFIHAEHYSSGSRVEYLKKVYDDFVALKMKKFYIYTGNPVEIPEFKLDLS